LSPLFSLVQDIISTDFPLPSAWPFCFQLWQRQPRTIRNTILLCPRLPPCHGETLELPSLHRIRSSRLSWSDPCLPIMSRDDLLIPPLSMSPSYAGPMR